MTCLDLLRMEHPECVDEKCAGGCAGCPHHYGYLSKPDYCDPTDINNRINCVRCWNRELPGETVNKQDPWRDIYHIIEEGMTKRDREIHIYINPETGISVNVIPWPDMEELFEQLEKNRITPNDVRQKMGLPKMTVEQYQDAIQHSSTKDKDVETLFKKSIWTEKEG